MKKMSKKQLREFMKTVWGNSARAEEDSAPRKATKAAGWRAIFNPQGLFSAYSLGSTAMFKVFNQLSRREDSYTPFGSTPVVIPCLVCNS